VAIGVKRRHDKDNNGMDMIIFYAIALVLNGADPRRILLLTFRAAPPPR
jgi:hypothetical protein